MSKEAIPLEEEALDRIKRAPTIYCGCRSNIYTRFPHECKILEAVIKELEVKREIISDILTGNEKKKLKALDIIKDKKVHPSFLLWTKGLKEYNKEVIQKLTQEEYDLLVEVLL